MAQIEVRTVIAKADRMINTKAGNPVWELLTEAGTFKTEPDAQVGYIVSDQATFVLNHDPVIITLNKAGRVVGIVPVGPKRAIEVCRATGHDWRTTDTFNVYICACGTRYESTPTGRRYYYPEGRT